MGEPRSTELFARRQFIPSPLVVILLGAVILLQGVATVLLANLTDAVAADRPPVVCNAPGLAPPEPPATPT